MLAPYHLDEMVTVMNVREPLDCNWKVVMDAFEEGYHINGIHPQLLSVIAIDPATSRYKVLREPQRGNGALRGAGVEPREADRGDHRAAETFPSTVAVLPRFEELVRGSTSPTISYLSFPDDGSARALLQQATRDTLTGMGLDVSGLTDAQIHDNRGWVLFPNYFMTIRAGECHVIMAVPHPDGNPNRCIWHVASYMYLPPEMRESFKVDLIEVEASGTYKYFEALHQDYVQMPRQQLGLRNNRLDHMSLVKEEVVIAHYHSVIDRFMNERG